MSKEQSGSSDSDSKDSLCEGEKESQTSTDSHRRCHHHRHHHHRRHHGKRDRNNDHRRHRHRHRNRSRSRSISRSRSRRSRSPSPLISRACGNHVTHRRSANRKFDLQKEYERVTKLREEALRATGVEIPKFYNPVAVDPTKYAAQEQKKKMLWSKASENTKKTSNVWMESVAAVSGDQSKFRKLMGIKSIDGGEVEVPDSQVNSVKQNQDELFKRLDHDYAQARQTAHTHRGIGLGYSTTLTLPTSSSSQL